MSRAKTKPLAPEQLAKLEVALEEGLGKLRLRHGPEMNYSRWSEDILHMDRRYLSSVMAGRTRPSSESVIALATSLGEDPDRWLAMTGHRKVTKQDPHKKELESLLSGPFEPGDWDLIRRFIEMVKQRAMTLFVTTETAQTKFGQGSSQTYGADEPMVVGEPNAQEHWERSRAA